MICCPDSSQTLKKKNVAVIYVVMKHLQESEALSAPRSLWNQRGDVSGPGCSAERNRGKLELLLLLAPFFF